MEQTEIRQKVEDILAGNNIGTLATVKNEKPFSRYMTFFNDNLTLYSATSAETHKTDDIEKNNNVHILLGYNGGGHEDQYIEIEGKATVKESDEMKQKLWKNELEPYFNGPHDPDYAVLEIKPTEIRLMNTENDPQILEM